MNNIQFLQNVKLQSKSLNSEADLDLITVDYKLSKKIAETF